LFICDVVVAVFFRNDTAVVLNAMLLFLIQMVVVLESL